MTTLATIATAAASMVNLRLMQSDGITPANSDYLARQKMRIERSLDWLERRVTEEGFAPGWFSIAADRVSTRCANVIETDLRCPRRK